jgi:hypothetical protein
VSSPNRAPAKCLSYTRVFCFILPDAANRIYWRSETPAPPAARERARRRRLVLGQREHWDHSAAKTALSSQGRVDRTGCAVLSDGPPVGRFVDLAGRARAGLCRIHAGAWNLPPGQFMRVSCARCRTALDQADARCGELGHCIGVLFMGGKDFRPRARYALSFGRGSVSVELEVDDRADAFAQAQKLVREGRPATLYKDGVALGQISYSPAGFWTVSEEGSHVS